MLLLRVMDLGAIIYRTALSMPGFLLAIVFHEAAHAYAAKRFGDNTAERLGRLTLNPMAHIDMFGTVIFPLIGTILGGFIIGWAKPVPVDATQFKKVRSGIFWVSFAGPLSNIFLGIICALIFALLTNLAGVNSFVIPLMEIFNYAVIINFILAVFNLIPLPPLDGSKMLSTFLNYKQLQAYEVVNQYSFLIFLLLMFSGALSYIIYPAQVFGQYLIFFFSSLFGAVSL